jgi:flagellar L-ring protein precursor FlgH
MNSRILALLMVLSVAVGCGHLIEKRFFPKPSEQEMAQEVSRLSQMPVKNYSSAPVASGSLWPSDDNVFLYADRKALRVGDIVTIRIVENAKANNTADTDLSRSSSLDASFSHFFSKEKFLKLFKLDEDLIKASSENSHKGAGSTTREGQLVATITAIVKEVLPNGNLVIQGTRAVVVNHEEQYITITGVVRPLDVNRDNVVLSSQVADASIAIGGLGVVADKQRSGWGTWIFDFVWPF